MSDIIAEAKPLQEDEEIDLLEGMDFDDLDNNIYKCNRKDKGLSQKQLANKLRLTQACISRLENNTMKPFAFYLIKYADFFKWSLDEVLPDLLDCSPKRSKTDFLIN